MATPKTTVWMADFETTTDPADCRVWAWGLANVETAQTVWDVEMGTDIESFLDRCRRLSPAHVYFHNLGFDGSFIIDHLLRHGFQHTQHSNALGKGRFTTLISALGKFYSITVMWENGRRTEFRDSLKKLPMSAAAVAGAFKLKQVKGSIDYDAPRPVGHQLTREERAYLATDVLIVAQALRMQFAAGMVKLTVGADSLADFKAIMGREVFEKMFPVLPESMDSEIRSAYRGGFTYADDRFKGKLTGGGRVYDVNSLYPSVMYDRLLPYGEPVWCEGLPSPTADRPLSIVSVTFTARLKPDHVPCIQIKNSGFFSSTEYQREILEPVTLMATNVDLALWEDHYDLDVLAYNGGWLFHGVSGVFKDFIDKWMKVKAESEGGMRTLAKLQLNSLYGKFATNPNVTGKYPVMEDDIVKLKMGPEETRDPVYTAMGVFITAYARDVTVRAAQAHYPHFAYADTDSLHLLMDEDPATLEVHPSRLGAWKFEYAFDSAMYIRAKAYVEHLSTGEYITHVAGLPDQVAKQVTFSDVVEGKVFHGKLVPKRVPGGVVLEDVGFTLHL